jgi:hypothetical protein
VLQDLLRPCFQEAACVSRDLARCGWHSTQVPGELAVSEGGGDVQFTVFCVRAFVVQVNNWFE